MEAMRMHDPLARLVLMGALIASLLTAVALILAAAVHRRAPGEPAPVQLEKR
jgi:crotonobetainyl-CoA:carnitine CoA-transferase CaiB-like acyl-CoA transferase